jgi:anionic cell wall polymer biosynthesis LytR-Cps2A-Psr (LCP) family protein
MGLPLDYYVIIEFEGLMQLVDALGGLRVDVEMDMDRDDNAGNLHIHLKKGMQLLSGREVVQYARYRDPKLADLGRMPRQQKVLRLLLQEMMKAEHRRKLPELARIMSESVRTNLALDQLVALAQHMDEYSPDCIQTKTLDSYYDSDPTMPEIQCQGVPEGQKVGAQRIYSRDTQAARQWLKDLAPPPPPAQVVADDTGPADNDDEQLAGEQ